MNTREALLLAAIILACLFLLVTASVIWYYGSLWLQARVSGARVTFAGLIAMSLRRVNARTIVIAQIMGKQAGLDVDGATGMSIARLEAHMLAGGNVKRVVQAIISAHHSGIDLDFDRAAAMDLTGRDILDAIQISITPRVIDCPRSPPGGPRMMLSAIGRDGVELLVLARVTVRTNLDQLIGGAAEETIIARVCQGIVSAVGKSASYLEVLATPDRIAKAVFERGLNVGTAFDIVSLDIVDVDVGRNVGARLRNDQAEADLRTAQARAEGRRANAVSRQQEMRARVVASRSTLLLAEAEIRTALAGAFVAGQLQGSGVQAPRRTKRSKTWQPFRVA